MTTTLTITQKRANLVQALFENITECYPAGMRETLADDRDWDRWQDCASSSYCTDAVANEPGRYAELTAKNWDQLRARATAYFAELEAA